MLMRWCVDGSRTGRRDGIDAGIKNGPRSLWLQDAESGRVGIGWTPLCFVPCKHCRLRHRRLQYSRVLHSRALQAQAPHLIATFQTHAAPCMRKLWRAHMHCCSWHCPTGTVAHQACAGYRLPGATVTPWRTEASKPASMPHRELAAGQGCEGHATMVSGTWPGQPLTQRGPGQCFTCAKRRMHRAWWAVSDGGLANALRAPNAACTVSDG